MSCGRIATVRDVSFSVAHGEIMTLLGANGACKCSVLNSLMGLVRGTTGQVHFLGENIVGRRTEAIVKGGLALVPEGQRIFPDLTVAENLRLSAAAQRYRAAAGTLSGGMQQMLAIGRALMSRPRLLLLDEPSRGIAPQLVDRISVMLAVLRTSGVTLLLVEQSIAGALALADCAYVLQSGHIAAAGTSDEVRRTGNLQQAYLGLRGATTRIGE